MGDELKKIKILTVVHFLAGVNYSAGTMLARPDTNGLLVLWFVMPLSLSMTTFYFWILNGLTETVQNLEHRRQHEKLKMYNRLWLLLVVSIILLAGFFVVNSSDFAHRYETSWQADHWRSQWFLLDGWLNLEYFAIFLGICWLWRPTGKNQRYGLQELPGDEQDVIDATALEEEDGVRVVGSTDSIPMSKRGMDGADPNNPHASGSAVFDIGEEDLETEDDEFDDAEEGSGGGRRRDGGSSSPNSFGSHHSIDLEPAGGPQGLGHHMPLASSTRIWASDDSESEDEDGLGKGKRDAKTGQEARPPPSP